MITIHHEKYMHIALNLAREGLGRVWPNPSVGCVIVKDGEIIGQGRTADGGRPHAEAAALAHAGAAAKGADVYVTLEPCAQAGREGACSDALIAAQVARVFIGCYDVNPAVFQKGVAKLRAAGIEVIEDILSVACTQSHAGFFTRITQNRPYVCLKQAISADGMIAARNDDGAGIRTQISGAKAQGYLHELRATYDAIAVGVNTVLADDPLLTTRLIGIDHKIVRIVFDSDLRIPLDSQLVKTAQDCPVWVLHKTGAAQETRTLLNDAGVTVIETGACMQSALNALAQGGITRLLVEGGAKLHHSFIQSGLYDETQTLRSLKPLNEDGVKGAQFDHAGLALQEKRDLDEDLLEIYRREA